MQELEESVKLELAERFEIVSFLGKGSFGRVYECQDRQNKQIYAVKVDNSPFYR